MKLKQLETEDLRLVILRLLAEASGYDLNSSILTTAVREFGHQPTRDKMHVELAWLDEQQLIETRTVGNSVVVAKLTSRGLDVAQGRAEVPGIKVPGPA